MSQTQKSKEPSVITAELELVELFLVDKAVKLREAQQRSLFKPCRYNKPEGCVWCKVKRYVLRKRYL